TSRSRTLTRGQGQPEGPDLEGTEVEGQGTLAQGGGTGGLLDQVRFFSGPDGERGGERDAGGGPAFGLVDADDDPFLAGLHGGDDDVLGRHSEEAEARGQAAG